MKTMVISSDNFRMYTPYERIIKIIERRISAGDMTEDDVTPNYVGELSYNKGANLTSEEVVKIADMDFSKVAKDI